MIAFPEMLTHAAHDALIPVPDNLEHYNVLEYPHWNVFCLMQLGAPMPEVDVHYHNAEIVARISEDEIMSILPNEIIKRGFRVGFSK